MSDDNDWGQPPRQQPTNPNPSPQEDVWGTAPQQPMTHQPGPPAKIRHQLEQNDIIALVASFFLPGLGHILAGQTMKGVAILAVVLFTCGFGYIANILIVADAYFVLMCKKDRPVGDWEFFPDYNRYV